MLMFIFTTIFTLAMGLSVGCGPSIYRINTPKASTTRYGAAAATGPAAAPATIAFADSREANGFTSGTIDMEMLYPGAASEVAFLSQSVMQELAARGVALAQSGGVPALTVSVVQFHMRNHQPSGMFAGFAPLRTATRLRVHVSDGTKNVVLGAFLNHAKTVMWSAEEEGVRSHLVDLPQELIAKEVATKIVRHFLGRRVATARVQQLASEIANGEQRDDLFRLVYELGYTNDPAAVPILLSLVDHTQELVRLAAITSLGMVGDATLLARLMELANERSSGAEGMAALKSIGDLGTPEAAAFLRQVAGAHRRDSEADRQIREVTSLFL